MKRTALMAPRWWTALWQMWRMSLLCSVVVLVWLQICVKIVSDWLHATLLRGATGSTIMITLVKLLHLDWRCLLSLCYLSDQPHV